jgi:hypothetical protein
VIGYAMAFGCFLRLCQQHGFTFSCCDWRSTHTRFTWVTMNGCPPGAWGIMMNKIPYRGYMICHNFMNGERWVEKDGHLIARCKSAIHGRELVDHILDVEVARVESLFRSKWKA